MNITLKGIATVGISAAAGVFWYEYICQEACKQGRMYRSLKRSDGSYSVYGDINAISPEDRDKIYTAQAVGPDE